MLRPGWTAFLSSLGVHTGLFSLHPFFLTIPSISCSVERSPAVNSPTYTYDLVGNLTNVTDPDSVLAMTDVLANRLMTNLTLSNGTETTYSYDPASQVSDTCTQLNGGSQRRGEETTLVGVAYRQYGYRLHDIAVHLGVDDATVSRWLKQAEQENG